MRFRTVGAPQSCGAGRIANQTPMILLSGSLKPMINVRERAGAVIWIDGRMRAKAPSIPYKHPKNVCVTWTNGLFALPNVVMQPIGSNALFTWLSCEKICKGVPIGRVLFAYNNVEV